MEEEALVESRHLLTSLDCEIEFEENGKNVSISTLRAAEKATQALINELFELPVERSDSGPIAQLPSSGMALPRFKPPPKPRAETKWQAFAKSKGIEKKKKGRMVWDEATGRWAPSWGYERAGSDDPAIIEMSNNEETLMNDPRAVKEEAKKARVAKNEKQRAANERRRSKEKRKVSEPLPVGVPIDLEAPKERKRGKESIDSALQLAQKSTASIGNFDALRQGEIKQKEKGKRRKFLPVVGERGDDSGNSTKNSDLERSLRVLEDVMRPKAQAPKKGQAERMDTYDGELPVDIKRKKGKFAASAFSVQAADASSSATNGNKKVKRTGNYSKKK
uniref:Ribosome biogenesis regulatory protein n=1 Tax=Aureoumbra lagunensis TaxID=44058 RepID=A0A7S3K4G3_9STRA